MSFRGAVISVGGTPDPIIFSLKRHRPAYVLFLGSEKSVGTVETVLSEIGYTPQHEMVKVRSQDDLDEIYEKVLAAIPRWLEGRSIAPEEVYVDFTGGTKPISAALAMAGSERFRHFNYVAGAQRDKGGLGTVVSGSEISLALENPLDKLAIRERELSARLFSEFYADAASQLLTQAAEMCSPNLRGPLSTLGKLIHLFAESDRFHFKNFQHEYNKIREKLKLIFSNNFTLFERIDALAVNWAKVEQEKGKEGESVSATVRELLANAERRARQGRYDDAVARLYRASELFAQGKLLEAFGAKLGKVQRDQVPEEHLEEWLATFGKGQDGVYRMGVRDAFRALTYSPLPEHKGMAQKYEAIRIHLQKRNDSILAHGLRPAREEDFQQFWQDLLQIVGKTDMEIPRWPELDF